MSGNFISHLLYSRFDSIIKSLGTYLVLDILEVLLLTFMGVLYSTKVYKHSYMSNVEDRVFSIMISLQIPRKLDLLIYVLSDSKSEGGED